MWPYGLPSHGVGEARSRQLGPPKEGTSSLPVVSLKEPGTPASHDWCKPLGFPVVTHFDSKWVLRPAETMARCGHGQEKECEETES
jgi:hypothetical protein